MNYWCELQKDAFSYFNWFDKVEAERMGGSLNVSLCSVVGSRIIGLGEKNVFLEMCGKVLKGVFNENKVLGQYTLYLFAVVETENSSRIAAYRKVWENLQGKFDVENFNKGPEIEIHVEHKIIYASIAEFKVEDILTALKLVESNPKKYAIFASSQNNLLTVEMVETIFNAAFGTGYLYNNEINYFHLSIFFCPKEDIVFRWGDSSEEAELDLIFNGKFLKLFQEIYQMDFIIPNRF